MKTIEQIDKPAFTTVFIDAVKMKENNVPFSVVIDDNEIKCYGVSKENWRSIEKDYDIYIKAGSCKPLICLDQAFIDTAQQMGWIIVGNV